MKNLTSLLLCCFSLVLAASDSKAQTAAGDAFAYEIVNVRPYFTVDRTELQTARTLSDLNRHYHPEWVRESRSVTLRTCEEGVWYATPGRAATLTPDQRTRLAAADAGSEVEFRISYLPENNLRDNPLREEKFSFVVEPTREARFPGPAAELKTYLKQRAADRVPPGTFQGYDLAAVKFTVTTAGEVVNAHIFESSRNPAVDAVLLAAVRDMPRWEPARYADGTPAPREMALVMGNLESCVMNLLTYPASNR